MKPYAVIDQDEPDQCTVQELEQLASEHGLRISTRIMNEDELMFGCGGELEVVFCANNRLEDLSEEVVTAIHNALKSREETLVTFGLTSDS